ncbi:MAG: RagB/SusD family nutrient uptake outer membrane protein, partial [Ginsengibacter sp.]
CNKFLDKLPDTRTELNSVAKVRALLATAYPQAAYEKIAELMSDNAQDKGPASGTDLMDQTYFTFGDFISDEQTQDGTVQYWSACYTAIAAANAALDAIEKAPNPQDYSAEKGEALVCRAYSHFMLTTLFAKPYDMATSGSDAGIPYVLTPETKVFQNYTRGTVKEDYDNIEKDLLEGLPLINDNIYTVPKYHFTNVASNAFAARFFLYKKDYQKSLDYANKVFPPTAIVQNMRPWLTTYKTFSFNEFNQNYTKATENANLLLIECPSLWARSYYGSRYGFRPDMYSGVFFTNSNPAAISPGRWAQSTYVYIISGQQNYAIPKWNEYFYAPDNPNYGYPYVMTPVLTTEEVIFNRAEANIYLGDFTSALKDMNLYVSQRVTGYTTADNITEAKAKTYAATEDTKTALIQSLLYLKRIEYIQEGMRWFDVLRYNIPVIHKELDVNLNTLRTNTLSENDGRRQWQIPQAAQNASKLAPNPRP